MLLLFFCSREKKKLEKKLKKGLQANGADNVKSEPQHDEDVAEDFAVEVS